MSGPEVLSGAAAGVAFAYFAAISILLSVVDMREHRLPNKVVLPSYAVALTLLITAAVLAADAERLLRATAGMVIMFAFYLGVRLASPASIGGGDVKLAGLLGVYLGWLGWGELVLGAAAAFLLGGAHALVLLLAGRADLRTRIPFGPAMIAGAWVAIAGSVAIAVSQVVPVT